MENQDVFRFQRLIFLFTPASPEDEIDFDSLEHAPSMGGPIRIIDGVSEEDENGLPTGRHAITIDYDGTKTYLFKSLDWAISSAHPFNGTHIYLYSRDKEMLSIVSRWDSLPNITTVTANSASNRSPAIHRDGNSDRNVIMNCYPIQKEGLEIFGVIETCSLGEEFNEQEWVAKMVRQDCKPVKFVAVNPEYINPDQDS